MLSWKIHLEKTTPRQGCASGRPLRVRPFHFPRKKSVIKHFPRSNCVAVFPTSPNGGKTTKNKSFYLPKKELECTKTAREGNKRRCLIALLQRSPQFPNGARTLISIIQHVFCHCSRCWDTPTAANFNFYIRERRTWLKIIHWTRIRHHHVCVCSEMTLHHDMQKISFRVR